MSLILIIVLESPIKTHNITQSKTITNIFSFKVSLITDKYNAVRMKLAEFFESKIIINLQNNYNQYDLDTFYHFFHSFIHALNHSVNCIQKCIIVTLIVILSKHVMDYFSEWTFSQRCTN